MNVFTRLGLWWDNRRKVTHQEFTKKIEELKVPPNIAQEMTMLKIRLDHLELYVGMKRDPKPLQVPGAAKIS